jgi:hypothetical protein
LGEVATHKVVIPWRLLLEFPKPLGLVNYPALTDGVSSGER